jgi:transmembrane sensor
MDRRTLDEAADWFVKLHDEPISSATRAQFADWLLLSPDHIQAFLDVTRTIGDLDASATNLNVEELIRAAAAEHSRSNVVPLLSQEHVAIQPRRPWKVFLGAAISVLILLAIVWFVYDSMRSSVVYQTEIGEQRVVALDDGTLAMINTGSELRVDRKNQRHVTLKRGEAQFQVAHGATAFVVDIPGSSAITTSAKLNVRIDPQRVSVGVIAGSAEVRTATQSIIVQSGQSVASINSGEFREDAAPPLLYAREWPAHRLSFEDRPLDEVAREFNRYHRNKLVIVSHRIEGQRVTGRFDIHDINSFILYLRRFEVASVTQRPNGDWELREKTAE